MKFRLNKIPSKILQFDCNEKDSNNTYSIFIDGDILVSILPKRGNPFQQYCNSIKEARKLCELMDK